MKTEITGIPSSIKGDYEVNVIKYVDSNGIEKSYDSIGSIIQEAGTYTIQIQPNEAFGSMDGRRSAYNDGYGKQNGD